MTTTSWAPPAIRAVALGAPDGSLDLTLGVPDWSLHPVGRAALARVAEADEPCGYGPNEGLPELVSAIAAYHRAEPAEVMVSHGSQGGLYALFAAHCTPGTSVLVPDPGFPAYPVLAGRHGADAVRYRLDPDGWLDAELFAEALQQAGPVSMAVINHPANPTGGGATPEQLRKVAAICQAAETLLVSDEVYRDLHLGPRPASLRDVTDTGVVLGSVSKAWAAPGLRIGWAIGSPEVLAPARAAHAAMTTAPARPSQVAATALLDSSDDVLGASWKELVRRWAVVQTAPEAVRATRSPAGGLYHWLALPEWAQDDPEAYCLRVRDEAKVIVVPGGVFGPAGAGYARISCGVHPRTLTTALERLAPWWEQQTP